MNKTALQVMAREPLDHELLKRKAPSIFSEQPHEKVSSKYAFVPTVQVVEQLEKRGWFPVNAQEQRVINLSRRGYQKHVIKFQSQEHQAINGIIPEIVLTNSHDRTSSFQFMAGLFRFICSNGLVVADAMFGEMKVRHIGYTNEQVHQVINQITSHTPNVLNRLEGLKQIELLPPERLAFATSAAMEKWKVEAQDLPFSPDRLLTTRRYEDKAPTLWNTYNMVQENLTKGELRYVTVNKEGRRARRKSRPIVSINENIRVNKALWTLTENMRRIKVGESIISK